MSSEIKTGDTVYTETFAEVKVLSICQDMAWVKQLDDGLQLIRNLSALSPTYEQAWENSLDYRRRKMMERCERVKNNIEYLSQNDAINEEAWAELYKLIATIGEAERGNK